MRERRDRSLLDFAIAASAGVVPVLLAVLLGIGVAVPGVAPQQSHVSVRQVAALKTFEQAIVRRSDVRSPLPDTP